MARVKRSVHSKKRRRRCSRPPRDTQGPGVGTCGPPTSSSCTRGTTRSATAAPQGRVPPALDRAHQRGLPRERHLVLAVHRRPEGGRDRGRPQDPGRPRRARSGGVRRARHLSSRGARGGLSSPLGPRHGEVKRLRALLRDPRARTPKRPSCSKAPGSSRVRSIAAVLESVYLGPGADVAFAPTGRPVTGRRHSGDRPRRGRPGEARHHENAPAGPGRRAERRPGLDSLPGGGPVVAAVDIGDPGNLGTIIRSAEAAGADAVIVCGNSVDVQNPKVVRSSAGAVFGLTVMETPDPMEALASLAADGRPRLGTQPSGATPLRPGRPVRGRRVRARQRGPRPSARGAGRARRQRHHPDDRGRRVAQRGHGRDRAAVRGGANGNVDRGPGRMTLDEAVASLAAALTEARQAISAAETVDDRAPGQRRPAADRPPAR